MTLSVQAKEEKSDMKAYANRQEKGRIEVFGDSKSANSIMLGGHIKMIAEGNIPNYIDSDFLIKLQSIDPNHNYLRYNNYNTDQIKAAKTYLNSNEGRSRISEIIILETQAKNSRGQNINNSRKETAKVLEA